MGPSGNFCPGFYGGRADESGKRFSAKRKAAQTGSALLLLNATSTRLLALRPEQAEEHVRVGRNRLDDQRVGRVRDVLPIGGDALTQGVGL
jgi:hypothetical protein